MDINLKSNKSIPAGSRLIAVNTQTCDPLNWHLLAERSDPGNQFAWLWEELLKVEANGGVAIIISHIDPSDCQHQWGTRYRALMERFQNVIRFGIMGHTHDETFQISKSMSNLGKSVLVNTIGGSVTTYSDLNPSFMVLQFDAKTLAPLNMITYYMDLEQANSTGTPEWKVLHDMLDYYDMPDMRPANFQALANRIHTDDDLAYLYEWNKSRQGPKKPEKINKTKIYCDLATSEAHEKHYCIKNHGYDSIYGQEFGLLNLHGILDRIVGNWIKFTQ